MNLLKLARMSLCVLLFLDVKCAASRIASCCTLITSGVNCISCRGVDLRCPVPRAVPIHEQYIPGMSANTVNAGTYKLLKCALRRPCTRLASADVEDSHNMQFYPLIKIV